MGRELTSSENKPKKLNKTDQIIHLLTEIRDLLAPRHQDDSEQLPMVHESEVSCPNCDLLEVNLGKTPNGYAIYRCKTCELVWVNDEQALK